MTIRELCELRPAAERNAHLYLWTTNSFMVEAHEVARAWGFEPKTILTWVKTRHGSTTPSMKTGFYFRGATEHVVFAVRGSMRLRTTTAFPTAYLWPRLPHSVKPETFYSLVEAASPGPYLEIFARSERPGWDAWGDGVDSDVKLVSWPAGCEGDGACDHELNGRGSLLPACVTCRGEGYIGTGYSDSFVDSSDAMPCPTCGGDGVAA